jgi:hypothetical protein
MSRRTPGSTCQHDTRCKPPESRHALTLERPGLRTARTLSDAVGCQDSPRTDLRARVGCRTVSVVSNPWRRVRARRSCISARTTSVRHILDRTPVCLSLFASARGCSTFVGVGLTRRRRDDARRCSCTPVGSPSVALAHPAKMATSPCRLLRCRRRRGSDGRDRVPRSWFGRNWSWFVSNAFRCPLLARRAKVFRGSPTEDVTNDNTFRCQRSLVARDAEVLRSSATEVRNTRPQTRHALLACRAELLRGRPTEGLTNDDAEYGTLRAIHPPLARVQQPVARWLSVLLPGAASIL